MSHTFKTRADDSIQSILSSLKTIGKILQDLPEDYDNREVAAQLRLADNNLDIVREELELTGLLRCAKCGKGFSGGAPVYNTTEYAFHPECFAKVTGGAS